MIFVPIITQKSLNHLIKCIFCNQEIYIYTFSILDISAILGYFSPILTNLHLPCHGVFFKFIYVNLV